MAKQTIGIFGLDFSGMKPCVMPKVIASPMTAICTPASNWFTVSVVACSTSSAAAKASAVLQQYMVAVGMGLGRKDDAASAKVYARNAGLTLLGADG